MANPDTDGLKIGDLISLQSPKWDCWLAAEGILKDDLVVSDLIQNFGDCLFAVHLQRQYSASRELESFLRTYNVEENGTLDDALKNYLKALQKGRDNEVALNDNYMEKKVGQSVNFGDIIQLFHVKSRKYLVINPKKLAHEERENSQAYLDPAGNIHSWMQFMPRFKIDREGDRILSGSEAFLRIAERSNEFIHAADKSPKPGYEREVNCSLENTPWRLTIFQDANVASDASIVLSSKLVYIHDPETRSNLTVATKAIGSFDEPELGGDEEDGNGFYHQFGDLISEPMGIALDARCIWSIETKVLTSGGAIQWKTDTIRFKNLATGDFLTVLRNPEDNDAETILTVTSDVRDAGTFFNVIELNSQQNQLSMSKALQISQEGVWLQRGNELDSKKFVIKGTKDKLNACSLLINEYIQFSTSDADALIALKNPLDVYSALSVRKYIQKYLHLTVIPRGSRTHNTIWPGTEKSDLEFFQSVVVAGTNFAQGFNVDDAHITLGVDKSNQLLRVQRQRLVQELGVLEYVLRMINKLKPITEMYDQHVLNEVEFHEAEKAVQAMGNSVLSWCLDFVYYCILDCPDNQMYVADFLPDLLAHLSTQGTAGKCVTAMLSTNMELQETKMGEREVAIFVDKLRSSTFNSMYLNLLQSCCSCQGQGVDANQCRVAEKLFEDPTGIIMNISVDFNTRKPANWNQGDSIYIKQSTEERPVQGWSLLEDGLPELHVVWESHTAAYSMQALFKTDKVSVSDLFPPSMDFKTKSSQGIKRLAIATYLMNEMYLGAEMCMDRNYVAMHKLDEYFSFECLVTIMKLDVHNILKAAACRLLFCLHIDRDPQAGTKIPCLTRTWGEVETNLVPQLPYVEPERRYVFSLVQQLCSEHVRSMNGRNWDAYSRFILQLLLGMTKFNFYGTVEKLQDVIGPVVSALDRRSITYGAPRRAKAAKIEKEKDESKDGTRDESRSDETETSNLDGSEEKVRVTWQKRTFEFMESLPVMCCILLLVLAAVGLTIYQVAANIDETPLMFQFGLVVLGIFLFDFFMRFYCYVHTYGKPGTFLKDPFNIIDQIVILIDLVFLFMPSDIGGDNAKFTKTLRLIRLVRLVRVLRAVKVINAFVKRKDDIVKYIPPNRYTKTPMFELETMTEAINVLLFVQSVVEDRNLTILLRYFYAWSAGEDTRSPAELFEQVLEDSQELSLDINALDEVLADNIMFVHEPLVQGTLNVLMAHHSSRRALLTNASKMQLLVSKKRQSEFLKIRGFVSRLEQNAETHELWGELGSDEDRVLNKETKEILNELLKHIRVGRFTLEMEQDFSPVKEMQDLLRNLGFFEISRKVLGLLDSVEPDEETGEFGEVALNTRELCLLCNEIVYWFAWNNPLNQAIVYEDLNFYLDSLESEIKSHKVIAAIFVGNEDLMKMVPHSLLSDMADKICQEGQSHVFLALAKAITHVGDKNIPKNQFEIIRSLCNPDRLEQTLCFIVPIEHEDYLVKREQMVGFKDGRDVDVDTLPPLLAYHLTFLEVLANCTSGKINISAVEAKVQSIYPLKDIIEAILEPDTILICKIRLSNYLLNAIIDVEMSLPGLCESRQMWNLIESFIPVLNHAKDEVRAVEKMGWETNEVSRHRIEYILIAVMIIGAFFEKNYDATKMRSEDGTAGADRVNLTMSRVNDIIVTLFNSIFIVYDLDTPRIQFDMKAEMYRALTALNKSATNIIVTRIVPIHLETADQEGEEKDSEELHEFEILTKYQEFYSALSTDDNVKASVDSEINGFVDIYEQLDSITSKTSTQTIRFEPFMGKLVQHVLMNMTTVDDIKTINAECTAAATWMIKAFRTQIENKMEMSIYERDDDGGEEEDEKCGPYISLLNQNGVTGLCLELIAIGIDETLQSEVIKLLVGMLFKEGGAREVQGAVNSYLMKNNSELFFKQVRATIQKLISWHNWNEIIILEEDQEPEPPEDILIIRMLQLLSEGHYLPNQDIMREQPNNAVQINLLDDFVNYFNVLSRLPCQTSTNAAIRVGATIVEVIQGPCVGNQNFFALSTEILEIQNRIMRAKIVNDCKVEGEVELKKICLDTISALLEGQMAKDQVTVRILSVIHIDILQTLAMPFIPEPVEDENIDQTEGPSEDEISLQTECVVLLQMLCDYKPSLRADMEEDDDFVLDSGSTASVEVSWNGILNRRFFHVPDVCLLLAKSSKDKLVQDVDRSNPENKLLDFLDRAQNLYREIKHQEYLTELGIAKVFSPAVHSIVTWIAFYLAVTINILFLLNYKVKEGDMDVFEEHKNEVTDDTVRAAVGFDDYVNVVDYAGEFKTDPTNISVPDSARTWIQILNYFQISASAFTIILTAVVRSPVIAWGLSENPDIKSKWHVALYTAFDPMTLYYCWYLLFACLGAFYHDMFITFLLLDLIVKNPTTADILAAVVIPRKQLAVAFVLGAFTIYIYTFFIFQFMPYRITADDDMSPGGMDNLDCVTLWGCYKYVFAYGFRAGGGIGDVMAHDIGNAIILHITFFLVVTVAMLNIIFGIIIDTFSGLRSDKNDRNFNTTETCFVCSIGRQVFDRAANSPSGFKTHIKDDHNMWNYLNFIFFLWEQDKDDDDGLEYYVRHKIVANEITWIPMHKAMCLDLGETDMEVMRGEVFKSIHAIEHDLLDKISDLQADANVVLDRLSRAIEQDYSGAQSIKVGISEFLAAAAKAGAAGVDIADDGSMTGSMTHAEFDELSVMSNDLIDKHEMQLVFHLETFVLPHFKTEAEFMTTSLIVTNLNGHIHSEKASKCDVKSHSVFFEPQNIVLVPDIKDANARLDADLKSITIDVLVSNLVLATETIKLSEFLDLAPNASLTKKFMIGKVECSLSAVAQHVSVSSMFDKNGNRVEDELGPNAAPRTPSRSVAATPRGRGTPGGIPGETKEERAARRAARRLSRDSQKSDASGEMKH